MATIKLKKNDLFIIIEHKDIDYFQFHGVPIGVEFTHHPSGDELTQSPDTFQCESDIEIAVEHTQYLIDKTFGSNLPKFVGPRPRNIVKR